MLGILNLRFISAVIIASTIFMIGCTKDSRNTLDNKKEIPDFPPTVYSPETASSLTSQRVSDLIVVLKALEQYKIDHRSYPISSGFGAGWDGVYSKYGESKELWIEGLVPDYLRYLPKAPESDVLVSQYLYRSNGAHFKLVALYPKDCNEIKSILPDLIDPKRDCYSYGFWTKRAESW